MIKTISFLSLIGFACMCCHVQHRSKTGLQNGNLNNALPTNHLNISSKATTGDQILFLTFSIIQDTISDTYNMKLTDSRLVSGFVKSGTKQEGMVIEPGYLYVECTDRENQRVEWFRVEDPLTRMVEFVEKDGSLQRKQINKKSGEVFLRFQYSVQAHFLSIFKPVSSALTLKKIYHATL